MPRKTAGSHHNNKLHVRTGDTVVVLSGKNKGQTGKVLSVSPRDHKVLVDGVNMMIKHVKPSFGTEGGRIEKAIPLHASKVALVDPETGKATRVHRQIVDGKKVRVAAASGKVID